MKFGNLVIAGLVTGSIYAVFAVCVSVWYRVSNILNLAVGDFAMLGALGVDDLVRVRNWPLPAAIAVTVVTVAAFGYLYDRVVLHLAQDGRRVHEGIVITFFFTFALSFFIDGVAKVLFGTDVHAAPALWSGRSLSLLSELHLERAGLLVLACAVICGSMFWPARLCWPRCSASSSRRSPATPTCPARRSRSPGSSPPPTAASASRVGIVWSRTPDNYENITQVLAAMEVIGSDGAVSLYDGTK
ncbi:MAG TPA: hypothetical protein VFV73_28420 [Streptosporangiaceae bacterium]|nr:hypothetical protein [Streptosporangiaceae bacterium]